MSTKKESPRTTGAWRTPIDELCAKLGFPLTTGNKTGSLVMPAPKRPLSGKSSTGGDAETNGKIIQ